jgi:hypothetical protein
MSVHIDYEILTDISNGLIAFVFRVRLSKPSSFMFLFVQLAISVTIYSPTSVKT